MIYIKYMYIQIFNLFLHNPSHLAIPAFQRGNCNAGHSASRRTSTVSYDQSHIICINKYQQNYTYS